MVILTITLVIDGIFMLFSLNWFNVFILCFVFGLIVLLNWFYCCCGSEVDQDESIIQRVKTVIDEWNSTNEENGVIAEFIKEKDEYRGKDLVTIPPSLNLFKYGRKERRILELQKKIP